MRTVARIATTNVILDKYISAHFSNLRTRTRRVVPYVPVEPPALLSRDGEVEYVVENGFSIRDESRTLPKVGKDETRINKTRERDLDGERVELTQANGVSCWY